ncbi:hypothetical protein [Estrella lausannensis]|uniref:Uncharacterized protein n=1 Tax=Estrella lausannensis TaxID=483423 RepID=A0A0H5DUD1_9BACT|nr:hypothetical protein [Estrella lausannensis]CRX39544.1 hypothetical protein ELAC_2224 [Estrella lausannensis]
MNVLSELSSSQIFPSSPNGEGYDTPSLPLEVTYTILEQIAECADTRQQLERDVKAFMIVQAQIFKRNAPEFFAGDQLGFMTVQKTIAHALAFSKLHACNAGTLTPHSLGIQNYNDLLSFIKGSGKFLKTLKINRFGIRLTDERALQLSALCPALKRLDLWVSPLSDVGLEGLIQGKKITSLKVSGHRLSSAFIASLANLPLTELSIDAARQCEDEAVQALLQNKKLKRLSLSYADLLTDRAFAGLENSSLESIDLTGLEGLTDEGVRALMRAPKLTRVALRSMPQVAGSAFSEDGEFRQRIEVLNLTGSAIENDSLAGIAKFSALSLLVLDCCEKITPTAVALLDAPLIGTVSLKNMQKKKKLLALPFVHHALDSNEWRLARRAQTEEF